MEASSPRPSLGPSQPPYASIARALLAQGRVTAARQVVRAGLEAQATDVECRALTRVLAPPVIRALPASGLGRAREFAWLRRHASEYHGQWVALNGDDLLASATSLDGLLSAIGNRSGRGQALVHHLGDE